MVAFFVILCDCSNSKFRKDRQGSNELPVGPDVFCLVKVSFARHNNRLFILLANDITVVLKPGTIGDRHFERQNIHLNSIP